MRRLLISILAILCALPSLPSSNPAHAEPSPTLYTCIFPDGPFAGQEILVRYDAPDAELSLVSNNTGETVQMLETGLNTPQFEVRGWSSDCRYMIASLGVWGEQSTAAWDVVENRRVGTIATKGQQYPASFKSEDQGLVWVPTNDYRVLIQSLAGAFLWHLPTNMQSLLTPFSDHRLGRNFADVSNYQWDLTRHQLLAVTLDKNRDGVVAYDIYTGQEVAYYPLNPTDDYAHFKLFNNGQHILVYAYDEPITQNSQLVVFNRDDGSSLSLSPIGLGFSTVRADFSASGRYLLVKTWVISIWDLQNLDSGPIHAPMMMYKSPYNSAPGGWFYGFRLDSSEMRLQAVNFTYLVYWSTVTIWQWDLATGERFYEKTYPQTVCDDLSQLAPEDDVELVTWACGYR